jgi:hypothetical protein
MFNRDKAALVRWTVPVVAALAGIGYLAAAAAGGHPWLGVVLLLIMLVFGGGVVLAGRRSETVAGLLDRRDERINQIDLRATALAGGAVIVAVVVAGIVELARDRSGAPYTWLAAVAAVTYVAGVLIGRVRA